MKITNPKAPKGYEGWVNPDGSVATHLPAIPPNDYKGTIANWMCSLNEVGYDCDSENFYGDITLTVEEYNELLERCEKQ